MADLLSVENLTTHIFTDAGTVRAVEGVNLRIAPGEVVALVGESGCGKSMTALSLMRLIPAPARILDGRVLFKDRELLSLDEGRMRAVRGGEMAMIFQDPMTFLNPVFRIGDQIAEGVRLHIGGSRRKARARALEALRQVHVPSPDSVLNYYPHQLSGGMRQRVLIAMAIVCRPALIIADEPTTALDVTIQAQIMDLLSELRSEIGSSMLLISHDLGLVAQFCDRVYVMYAGQIVEEADIYNLFQEPQHPYTAALMKSTLDVNRRVEAFETIEGQPPSLITPPPGCRFHPRCPHAFEPCGKEDPPAFDRGEGRWAKCWLHGTRDDVAIA